jgi:hypothetical protein
MKLNDLENLNLSCQDETNTNEYLYCKKRQCISYSIIDNVHFQHSMASSFILLLHQYLIYTYIMDFYYAYDLSYDNKTKVNCTI